MKMPTDFSFESACKAIKGTYPELAQDIDKFSSLTLVAGTAIAAVPIAAAVGPAILTPAAIILTAVGTFANLLGVKNEILTISETILAKLASKKEKDTLKHFECMEQAYSLTCYTSFFEALYSNKELIPLLKKIKLSGEEKRDVAIYATKDVFGKANTPMGDAELNPIKFEIDLPQPGDTFDAQRKLLLPLYQQLARRVAKFLELESVRQQIEESGGQEQVKKVLEHLTEDAFKRFRTQYYSLAMQYSEFAVWLNLQENEKDRTQLREGMAEINQKLKDIIKENQEVIDIGFKHLEEIINAISLHVEHSHTDAVLQQLETWYTSTVDKPIIDDPYSEYDGPTLMYPKKREIFIPQAFQVLHYTGEEHLEHAYTWSVLPERNDLSDFLLNYFNHPVSIHKPLIILGQPGSGKSLLTSMLAARLSAPASLYAPIRVELRHVNTEASIAVQIKDQISKDTNLEVNWGELTNCLVDRPPLVIFDGYDELLQATGKVFSGYLSDVEAFQGQEWIRKKPIRTIVTSRINLIDKAVIPRNATIIRLLEFKQERQNEWISRWNSANSTYFEQAQVEPFILPQNNKSIIKLAEQPLLLMMLAIYDSIDNPLRRTKNLDQSLLYDELLRRFIERELRKDEKTSRSWQKEELDKAIDREMERLGVAAVGMFNRRRLHIHKEELDADLKFFNLGQSSLEIENSLRSSAGGRDLLAAEKMFGSFFFQQLIAVHKPLGPAHIDKHSERGGDIAYEFLHNTFGEFLTADFMLRKILEETAVIHYLASEKILKNKLLQTLEKPDGLEPDWYARFMYAPLISRPVIIVLLREWSRHCLQQKQRNVETFLGDFDAIITSHINFLLAGNTLPPLMIGNSQEFSTHLPITGHLAIYTLNLIVLRTLLAPNGYTFDETKHPRSEDGTRAWDRLTYLWRSWFSLETLNELAAILLATREDTKIHLKIKAQFITSSSDDRLESILNVSLALADDITAGLVGLLSHNSLGENRINLSVINEKLRSENIDLRYEVLTKHLREFRTRGYSAKDIRDLFREISPDRGRFDFLRYGNSETLASFLQELIRLARISDSSSSFFIFEFYSMVLRQSPPSRLHADLSLETIKLAREVNDFRFLSFLYEELFGRHLLNRTGLSKRTGFSTEVLIEVIRLAREFNDRKRLEVFYREELLDYFKQRTTVLEEQEWGLSTELLIEVIKLAREFNDRKMLEVFYREELLNYFKQRTEFFRAIGREFGLEPSTGLSTELLIEAIKLAREFNDRSFLQQGFYREYFLNFLRQSSEKRLFQGIKQEFLIELIIEVIKISRKFGDFELLEVFYHEYLESRIHIFIDFIPLHALSEMHWLARQFKNRELLRSINKVIDVGRTKSSDPRPKEDYRE